VTVEALPAAGEPNQTASGIRLPPGPPLPRWVQTLCFLLGGQRFLELCRRRYGDAVFMRTLFDNGFVMLFEPTLVRQLFQGPHEQLNAGEANALLGAVLGQRSVLVLDGAEHLRHRKLMLPPFHGRRMLLYEQAVVDAAKEEIASWPVGTPFPLLPSMQSLTLRVIVRAVFGYEPGPAEQELRQALREMITPVGQPRGLFSLLVLPRFGIDRARDQFATARARVDRLLYAEIARRRSSPPDAAADDVFSALLLAQDERGNGLSDQEVRDELVTLLVAGHETTATGLAWALDLLLHNPIILERARSGDDPYLDAVVKEALRLRPVIPAVGRVVRGEPFSLGPWTIPDGVEINPSIRTIHRREDLYAAALEFQPERFLAADPPDTYTWLPFGGGTRRCLGASFAQMEMRVALRAILQGPELQPASPALDEIQFRSITLAPKHGVRVIRRR
jgi:cytochrome P450